MKKGLILINAYSRLPAAAHQCRRLQEEFAALGVTADICRNNGFMLWIDGQGEIDGQADCDFCVYLDKDKYVSRLLEKRGVRLFNRHAAVQACDDKAETHILLAGNGIAMPMTLTGLLCYDESRPVADGTLDIIEQKLGYPLIAKACYGSLGRDVYKIDNRAALARVAEKLKCRPHLFQACVKESLGRDIRVIVIGGRVVAAMQRRADGDFRSNIGLGGRGVPLAPDRALEELCVRAADLLGLDYCGIDVLYGRDGYLLCEVNSNAFFGGMEQATGINVARAYAHHVYRHIYGVAR